MGVVVLEAARTTTSTPLPNPPPPKGRPRPSSTGYGGRERESAATLTTLLATLFVVLISAASAIAQTTFTPRDETPEDFPAGAGRDETFYACTACHGFRLVAQQGMTRPQWEESLALMTRRHNMPPLDDTERAVVLNYLEAAYPPRAPAGGRGWQNPFSKQ